MSITRGLLKSLFAIGTRENLVPRCRAKSSSCFEKPYYGFTNSRMGHP